MPKSFLIERHSENITTWHGSCMAHDRKALQRVIKTAENIIGAHLQSISDIDEVPAQDPKDSKWQHPPSHSLFTPPRKKLYHRAMSSSSSLWGVRLNSSSPTQYLVWLSFSFLYVNKRHHFSRHMILRCNIMLQILTPVTLQGPL